MKPKKRASSLSKREKIRRKPFNRLNKRSTSLRLLVHLFVVLPWRHPCREWRDYGNEPQFQG